MDTTAVEFINQWSAALPNGKGVLFIAVTVDGARLAVADEEGNHRLLDVAAVYARYASTGHVVYVTIDGTLLVAPFDEDRLEITGSRA